MAKKRLKPTHKRGPHYSREEMLNILSEKLLRGDACYLVECIHQLPYMDLDSLYEAIDIIRRGQS